jgi:hypothetical protein
MGAHLQGSISKIVADPIRMGLGAENPSRTSLRIIGRLLASVHLAGCGGTQSAQSAHEVLSPQMCIALEHSKLFVSANRRHLGDVQSLLEEAADTLVSEIVEAKVIHLGTGAKMLEGEADRITRHGKHPVGVPTLFSHQALKDGYGTTRQWNVARVAVLRQRQMSDAANEVDVLLLQVEHFATTHRPLDRENDQGSH